ncbi:MAG: pyridoxamine 5'-phosphate oxidase family protein [candidate division Zixibacteria bacterium]|nr:pyridoxamine 5'-phosphate oxidase family protein [candidate division Zixibacteria bacterium]
MSQYPATPRTRVKQLPKRGVYDRATVHAILDEALLCHIGFVHDNQPYVIPTIHARVGITLYMLGSAASRMLKALSRGVSACVTVTLLDGLVLSRSTFHHSMNYRSVVILGTLETVDDPQEKLNALNVILEHIVPGRSTEARGPNELELKATTVVRMQLSEVSAKIRTSPPIDDEADYALPVWAGVLPLSFQPGLPMTDPRLSPDVPVPSYVDHYDRSTLQERS